MEEFNEFIEDLDLIDLPLTGRKYTWHRSNGSCMSRIDRFLISEEWASQWDEVVQWGQHRTVSYHCPLVLKPTTSNWGPKPFRVLNCWLDNSDFGKVVEENWRGFAVSGTPTYILKEKLKLLKHELRVWNRDYFGRIEDNIHNKVEEIILLD